MFEKKSINSEKKQVTSEFAKSKPKKKIVCDFFHRNKSTSNKYIARRKKTHSLEYREAKNIERIDVSISCEAKQKDTEGMMPSLDESCNF